MKSTDRGIKRLIKATGYSLSGLKAAWDNEEAFRIEVVFSFIIVPSAFLLGSTAVEIALLVGFWLLVLVAELINSAIEAIVDRIGSEHNELSGRAKDLGSATVFVAILIALLVWGIITINRFCLS